jgi:translation initiation factor IF-2
MATSSEVSRRVATPAWAWAVAALCVLLLAPVIVDRHGLVNRAAPLQVAGARPATNVAGVALAAGPRPGARPGAPARQVTPKAQPARAALTDASVSASRRGPSPAEVDAASRPARSAPAAVGAAPSGPKLIAAGSRVWSHHPVTIRRRPPIAPVVTRTRPAQPVAPPVVTKPRPRVTPPPDRRDPTPAHRVRYRPAPQPFSWLAEREQPST